MRFIALIAVFCLTASCGPHLGDYGVTDLKVVQDLPSSYSHSRPPEPYLRIQVRSEFDLAADGNGNIYAHKVDCSYFGDELHIMFGPLTATEPPQSLYDALPAVPKDAEGMAQYYLYLPISAPQTRHFTNSDEFWSPYDLETDSHDLCIKITQSGYFLTESASELIKISANDIKSAIGNSQN